MDVRNIPVSILRPVVRTIYSGPIKRIGDRLGVTSTLANQYWSLLYRISGDTIQHEIDDVSVQFNIKSVAEFKRFENLMDERPVIEDVLSHIREEDVFFDIGANVGVYTCFLSAVLPQEQVYAFEPHPANIRGLSSNLELNELNAHVQECALTAESTEIELAIDDNAVGVGTHSIVGSSSSETITVPGERGDDLLAREGLPQPTVLKIDVEGAEHDVVEGLKDTLANESCRLVYCEIHPGKLGREGSEEFEEDLKDLGFDLERIHERDDEYFVRGTKRP